MITTKISAEEAAPLRISALPTRPTAPIAFGGKGYTAAQMKEAFDKLPELIIERLNSLIEDITTGAVLDGIPTGIEGHATVRELLGGIIGGTLAARMTVFDTTLTAYLSSLREDVDRLLASVGEVV